MGCNSGRQRRKAVVGEGEERGSRQKRRKKLVGKKKEEERQANLTPMDKLREAKMSDFLHAGLLYGEFNRNEVAASEKYKGKTIMVVGEIDRVEKGGALSSDCIYLKRNQFLEGVRCAVAGGNTGELAKLRPGQFVHIEGRCDGKNIIGVVEMSGCIFVAVQP